MQRKFKENFMIDIHLNELEDNSESNAGHNEMIQKINVSNIDTD